MLAGGPARAAHGFDFRRPSKFSREHVRGLEVSHQVFARRVASGLGSALHALVQVEAVGIDQMTYDEYIRSLPNPDVLAVVALPPLPGAAVIECSAQLALQLVDRMLGGRGLPVPLRRPTELESYLVGDLMGHTVSALSETLESLDTQPELSTLDYNPHLVQVAAPSDMVLLLSFRVSVSPGAQCEGLLTLCYPASTLQPVLDRLSTRMWAGNAEDADTDHNARAIMTQRLRDVPVELAVRLADSRVAARDLRALAVGDVLRLDHRIGQTVRGCAADTDVMTGHVGRRGRRLAFQVEHWLTPPALFSDLDEGPSQ
jgi:flagellar motor switch protein FliM